MIGSYVGYVLVTVALMRLAWKSVDPAISIDMRVVVGLTIASVIAVVLPSSLAPTASEAWTTRVAEWVNRRRFFARWFLLALAILAPAAIAFWVLDGFQNSGDEFAYFFQGEVFAQGHLWARAPPLGYTFVPHRTWIIGDKWLSQYPPGWPLALALTLWAGVPAWLLNSIIGVGSAVGLSSPLWRFKNGGLCVAVVALYLSTPFYLLNAASFHSHMMSAALILLVCLCCLSSGRDHRVFALIGCGAALGLLGLTRYFSLILLLPALGYWWLGENRRDRVSVAVIIAFGALPFVALLLSYQSLITGSALRSTYSLIAGDDVFVSFAPQAVLTGMKLTIRRFAEFGVWTSPLLLPAYLACLAYKLKRRSIAFYDVVFPSFVLGYVFFADLGGNRYGPRYYFDAFPMMLTTIISAVPPATAATRRFFGRPLVLHTGVVSAIYMLLAVPFVLSAFHRQVYVREEPYRLATTQGLEHAIVVLESSSGLWKAVLARNDPALQAPVLYARAGVTVGELRGVFPDRAIWSYTRDRPDVPGRLTRVPTSVPDHTRLEIPRPESPD